MAIVVILAVIAEAAELLLNSCTIDADMSARYEFSVVDVSTATPFSGYAG